MGPSSLARRRHGAGRGLLLALLAGAAFLADCDGRATPIGDEPRPPGAAEAPGTLDARVLRVIDGDTIEVELAGGERADVRYIGVDTPESVKPGEPVQCFGKAAAAFNRGLVEGRIVTLRLGVEQRDDYGRLLAYVRTGGRLVNAELLRRGLARTLTIAPNDSHARAFARLETAAGRAGKGLWRGCNSLVP